VGGIGGAGHRRELDVLAVGAGVPVPSFLELEARDKVRYIAFSQGQLAELRLAMPELSPSRIPAGMYPSLLRNYETVGSTTSLWRAPTCPTTSSIKWSGQSLKTETK
jgi:TRAP-type uncharacterized transport system substrate-binding protein